MSPSFSYTQPALTQLLILTSFLYFLNVVRVIADALLHAGIIAELSLGIVYGSPLAAILPQDWEATFDFLGYLGLVCIVFEGGLSTNLPVLLSNLPLSSLCALTGITVPIGLSFALLTAGFGYKPLEAFAAGAALSSTSLGTTLAALNSVNDEGRGMKHCDSDNIGTKLANPDLNMNMPVSREDIELVDIPLHSPEGISSGPTRSRMISPAPFPSPSTLSHQMPLQQTRIGTVLISAAVIDDVVGLVIAALIPALANLHTAGPSAQQPSDLAWTLTRPLLSSLLIALVTPLVARYILRPSFWFHAIGEQWCAPRCPGKGWGWTRAGNADRPKSPSVEFEWGTDAHADTIKLGLMVCVLSAFLTIAYWSSMLFGAYIAGLTLAYMARVPETAATYVEQSNTPSLDERSKALSFESAYVRMVGSLQRHILAPLFFASVGYAIPFLSLWNPTVLWRGVVYAVFMCIGKLAVELPIIMWSIGPRLYRGLRVSWASLLSRIPNSDEQPTALEPAYSWTSFRNDLIASIYPATFMGIAMVSRGEIGLLIAQIARQGPSSVSSPGADGDTGGLLSGEAFLVSVWAILLCTLIGPMGVGFMVRRWRKEITLGPWS